VEPDPEALRRREIAGEDRAGADEPVTGTEDPADHLVETERGIEPGHVTRAHLARLGETLGMLDRLARTQDLELGGSRGEPQIPGLLVPRIDAGLRLEPLEFAPREQREPHIHRRGILGAVPSGGAPGAPPAGSVAPVEQDDIASPPGGEVIRHARAHHPGSDHGDRAAHAVKTCSG
jgi:hypothetical protein